MKERKRIRKSKRFICLLMVHVLMFSVSSAYPAFATEEAVDSAAIGETAANETEVEMEPASMEEPTTTGTKAVESASIKGAAARGTEEAVEPASMEEVTASGTEAASDMPEEPQPTYVNGISGMLWHDANEDGKYDSGEQAVAGYSVTLYRENDRSNVIRSAITDPDGMYLFENIEPGSYVVGIKSETENATEYLLPLCGITDDNKFTIDNSEWIYAYTNPIEIADDTDITDMNAGMRTPPGIQPMATSALAVGAQLGSTTSFRVTAITATTSGLQITFSWNTSATNVYYLAILWGTNSTLLTTAGAQVVRNLSYIADGYYAPGSGTATITITGTVGTTFYIGYGYGLSQQGGTLGTQTDRIYFTTRSITEYCHNIDASDTTYGVANNIQAASTLTFYDGTYTKTPGNITTGSGTSATTYTYAGYNTTNNRTTIGTSVSQSITANTSLYYYYRRNVTVNFNANGGSGAPSAVTRASNVALGTVTSPTRAGYTFAGWNTAAGGTGTTVTSSTYARAIPTTTNRNTTTLYAQWTANNNTVAFNANGGTPTPASISRTAVTALGTLPTVTRPGYTFAGWWTATSGGTQASATSTPIGLNSSLANNATLTLYARWTPHTITVRYEPNGGTGSMADSILTYGVSTVTTPNAFIRTDYEFTGWHAQRQDNCWHYLNPDNTSERGWYLAGSEPGGWIIFNYSSGANLAGMDAADGDIVTLYAQWEPIVTVEYVDTGGTPMPGSSSTTHTVTSGSSFTATVRSFTGYALKDWELDGVSQGDTNPVISNVTAPCTITLVYDALHTVTVTYADKNGTLLTTQPSAPGISIINGGTFILTTDTVSQYTPVYYTVDGTAIQYALTDTQTVTAAMNITVYFASTVIDVTIPVGSMDFHVDQTTYPYVEAGTFGQNNIYYTFANNSDYPIDVEFNAMQVVTANGVGFVASHTGGGSPEVVLNLDIAPPSVTGSINNAFITGVGSLNPSGSYTTSIGVMEGQFINTSTAAQGDTGYLTLSGTYAGPLSSTVKQPALKFAFTYSLVTAP